MVEKIISFIGVLSCGSLASFVFIKDRRFFVSQVFTVGMMVLAIEALLAGLSFQSALPAEVVRWQHLRMVAASFLPGIWLLFSLTFARANPKEFVSKWRWMILASFIIPFILATVFWKNLFIDEITFGLSNSWVVRLGWSGYLFYLFNLICAVFILINLERTFRASSGAVRWQIKLVIMGLVGVFAFRIYSGSQALLFYSINSGLEVLNILTVIIADILIAIGLTRLHGFNVDVYLSQTFLYNSLIFLIVGIYLLFVGLIAKLVGRFHRVYDLPFEASIIFIALLGLSVFILSERLRQKMKGFISRHLKRPQYDYRKIWWEFNQRTIPLISIKNLCAELVKIMAEIFSVSSVTLWLLDDLQSKLVLGGSTVFSENQAENLKITDKGLTSLIHYMCNQNKPIDLDRSKDNLLAELKKANSEYFREARIRYLIPLVVNEKFLGVVTLNDRMTKEPFSVEDFDLVKTIVDQAARSVLNLKFSERLLQLKEAETLQTISGFVMHDLKNLASTFSLTLQNLPVHFDHPDFRRDTLQLMQQSMSKINQMCKQLSMVSEKIELKLTETDLNEVVKTSLSCLNGSSRVSLFQDLQPISRLFIDPEQFQKVLINLIMNANEAVEKGGEIRVTTEQREGWVIISVVDNGCGMSKEFIERSLFHPFKTTKKNGMGIGLFHSKMIVEAHKGRIEVESEEGKGSTFRVLLPLTEGRG
jgi:putative PEP-CTERM system histidine kinase